MSTAQRRRRGGAIRDVLTDGGRAVIYARVSTLKTSQTTSLVRQLAELRDVVKLRRWRLAASCTDRLSGGRDDRRGLQTALDHIFAGRADVLVVHDLDRLGRNVETMLRNVREIHACSGNFFIRNRNIDTSTPEGRLTFTLFAALAEFQRAALRERIMAGLAFARKKGVRLGRKSQIPPAALDRAVALRRRQPPLSWSKIVATLAAENLGAVSKGAISGAVTTRLESLPKSTHRKHGKNGVPARHLRAV